MYVCIYIYIYIYQVVLTAPGTKCPTYVVGVNEA